MPVCANVVMMATASAPSPIYPLYQERWGLSVTMLTVVFAVYVVGLLGALLTVGSLSDHRGRRPVLVAALPVAAASKRFGWRRCGREFGFGCPQTEPHHEIPPYAGSSPGAACARLTTAVSERTS
ncbi:MFS transporter [Streptomyces sp. NPDC052292]|uniref:MFS transporter n=1 Tax=Streptomyces sp. NPDC052292 TaxID=3155053 RepID=UPI00342A1643